MKLRIEKKLGNLFLFGDSEDPMIDPLRLEIRKAHIVAFVDLLQDAEHAHDGYTKEIELQE